MSDIVTPLAEYASAGIEAVGIALIVLAGITALVHGVARMIKKAPPDQAFKDVRLRLGRGVLLGLEFLVAADIIRTVAVKLSMTAVAVLALIVVIRTFLSFTLEVELTGKWPWQHQGEM